jgi:hypothetical protein
VSLMIPFRNRVNKIPDEGMRRKILTMSNADEKPCIAGITPS